MEQEQNVKVLFPLRGNEEMVDQLAVNHPLFVFGGYILYEGDEPLKIRQLLKGGCSA